jgi:hypothetical protein
MNDKHLIWINPHAPAIGEKTKPVPRRRRAKLMFQDERQEQRSADDETAEQEYHDRRAKK